MMKQTNCVPFWMSGAWIEWLYHYSCEKSIGIFSFKWLCRICRNHVFILFVVYNLLSFENCLNCQRARQLKRPKFGFPNVFHMKKWRNCTKFRYTFGFSPLDFQNVSLCKIPDVFQNVRIFFTENIWNCTNVFVSRGCREKKNCRIF